jgi:hypothetical protein
MRARLKGLVSPDVADLEDWLPDEPDRFGFYLQVSIGPADAEGEEGFGSTVCSPQWFAQRLNGADVICGEHTMLMRRYDYGALVRYVERRCHRCVGETWVDIVNELRLFGQYEFDGYRSDAS